MKKSTENNILLAIGTISILLMGGLAIYIIETCQILNPPF